MIRNRSTISGPLTMPNTIDIEFDPSWEYILAVPFKKTTCLLLNNHYDPKTGCWNWTASKQKGYGVMRYLGRAEMVHRISAHCFLRFDLRSPLKVLHKCDNKACFNPKHLFIGTQKDNIHDAIQKGRMPQATRNA